MKVVKRMYNNFFLHIVTPFSLKSIENVKKIMAFHCLYEARFIYNLFNEQ